ncbi:hypothetical protein [Sphingobacterium sp.]|uniref:hypothetical protein n=1 Tax=Sphingobacterium sp. TaxID=341027 RepID=UPI0031D260AE
MKNNIWIGLGLGVIFPLVAFLLLRFTAIELYFLPEKPMATYTIAVLINLVFLRFAYRSGNDQIGKGIIIMTFLAMILYLITHKVTV